MTRHTRKSRPPAQPGAAAVVLGILVAGTGFAQQQVVPNAAILDAEQDDPKRFVVEIIVFEYAGNAANTTEIFDPEIAAETLESTLGGGIAIDAAGWPDSSADGTKTGSDDGRTDLAVAVDTPEDAGDEPFVLQPGEKLAEIPTYEWRGVRILPPEDYQLGAAYRKLVELDAYRPLMHAAWIQPAVAEEDTEPLKLRRIGNPPLRLDGTISLYLGRYLHLVVDLALEHREPQRMPPDRDRIRSYGDDSRARRFGFEAADIVPITYYTIREDRILRSNETRYFDHPKFGVIARVTRLEEALPESADTTDDLQPGPN